MALKWSSYRDVLLLRRCQFSPAPRGILPGYSKLMFWRCKDKEFFWNFQIFGQQFYSFSFNSSPMRYLMSKGDRVPVCHVWEFKAIKRQRVQINQSALTHFHRWKLDSQLLSTTCIKPNNLTVWGGQRQFICGFDKLITYSQLHLSCDKDSPFYPNSNIFDLIRNPSISITSLLSISL